jgi:cytochrome P450
VLYFFAKPRETPLADKFVLDTTAKDDPANFTLLSRLLEKSYNLERLDVAAECLDHMAAGIDTTGDALCFLMWELSQPSSFHCQEELQDELRRNPDVHLDQLSFLEAVVLEGLRCFPAIPMSLPRYVPRQGRTIDGYFIPEHTIVSCQAYSVHRIDAEAFFDPDTFNPYRWLEKDGDAARKRLFFAFANGGRGCVGKQCVVLNLLALRPWY